MSSLTQPPAQRATLPRSLHDFVVEMAVAVHKRSIYPAGHPIMMGAVEAVHGRLADILRERADLAFGVAERRLVIDGISSDGDHPLLSEFAARLGDHVVGAFRFARGVSRHELDAFLDAVAQPVDEQADPLGRRRNASSAHVTILPIAFDRLGLLDGTALEPGDDYENATWRALAAAALHGHPSDGDALDPRVVAAAIGAGSGDAAFDAAVIERLSAMLEELGVRGHAVSNMQRQRVSELVASIGEPALTRLLQVGGASRGTQVVRAANDSLGARAVLELVRAASSSDAVPISQAMLRLLQKLTTTAQQAGTKGAEADRVLRNSIRRLLDGWTLENPNPEMYDRLLEHASTIETRVAVDYKRDAAEPSRVLDICLEAQYDGAAAVTALSQLAQAEGLASVIARLEEYPASAVRDAMLDRVLNEASLEQYLTQPDLDVTLLRQAVDHMKVRAVGLLLNALDRRPPEDGAAISELLSRIGLDVLELLGPHVAGAPPRLLRHLLAVFDRIDAWPWQAEPSYYATHPDVAVRREAIKFLIKREATRESAILTALSDRDVGIMELGFAELDTPCPADVAAVLMSRYDEPELSTVRRVELIRLVASSTTRDAELWLGTLLLSRRWILGPRLRPPTPENIAAAAALVARFGDSSVTRQVVSLAQRNKAVEYRRAVYRSTRGAA